MTGEVMKIVAAAAVSGGLIALTSHKPWSRELMISAVYSLGATAEYSSLTLILTTLTLSSYLVKW